MEVIRPSTPMPYATRVSKCFKNRRQSTSSCLPHLQPLVEERLIKNSNNIRDLVKPFQRFSIACDEGENVEVFQIPTSHAKVLRIPDNRLNSNLSRLPCIGKDDLYDMEALEQYEKRKLKQNEVELCRTRLENNSPRKLLGSRRTSTSSCKSASSLPRVEKENNVQRLLVSKRTNTILQRHIQQEAKNFDPTRNKEVIFQKYFEGQR